MAGTWDDQPKGVVYGDKVNSGLYFAENRRNRWTAQGGIPSARSNGGGGGGAYRPTSIGINQVWRGENYQGYAATSEGGVATMGRAIGSQGADLFKQYQNYNTQQTEAYNKGVDMWQGAYQQGSKASQSNQLANQYADAYGYGTATPTSTPWSSTGTPGAINANLTKMFPKPAPAPAPAPLPFVGKGSPASINANLGKMYPPQAPTPWNPARPASSPAKSRTMNRPWSRPSSGWT